MNLDLLTRSTATSLLQRLALRLATTKQSARSFFLSSAHALPTIGGDFSTACCIWYSGGSTGESSTSAFVPAASQCRDLTTSMRNLRSYQRFSVSVMEGCLVGGETHGGSAHYGCFRTPVK